MLMLLLVLSNLSSSTASPSVQVSAFIFPPLVPHLPRRNNRDGRCIFRASTSNCHEHDSTNERDDAHEYGWTWEDSMRKRAAEALIPVFYPRNNSGDPISSSNLNKTQSSGSVDPEKALKKALRRYQSSISTLPASSATSPITMQTTTVEERHASRKRLSDLILGTSVMRIRHYYSLLAKNAYQSGGIDLSMPHDTSNAEPIMGLDPSSRTNKGVDISQRMHTVRAMVDLHAQYVIQSNLAGNVTQYPLTNYKFRTAQERISILYSLPMFLVKMLMDQYGAPKTEQMAAVFNQPGPITIRRNCIKCPSDDILAERLHREHKVTTIPLSKQSLGVDSIQSPQPIAFPTGCIRLVVGEDSWSPSKKSIWSMQAWKDGWFEVQDAGSQLIVQAAEVQAGDVAVDYCAGNGGKTFALASQMHERMIQNEKEDGPAQRRGYVIAHDIIKERLRQLQGSFERVGLVTEDSNDSGQASGSSAVMVKTTMNSGVVLHKEMADVVLVDAPCSSTGVLRRRPGQRFKLKEENIMYSFPSLQTSILREASELVKTDGSGRLVYATCSVCHHENEKVVEAFESQDYFDKKWARWDFKEYDGSAISSNKDGPGRNCRTLLPNANNCDGFFMARWRRL